MKSVIDSIINPHDRRLKKIEKRVENILDYEDKLKNLSDEDLKNKTVEFKERLKNGQTLDNILEEVFAVVREASHRVLGMKHYPVQLMGGIVLHEGDISQMQTGEGKTLVATLPSYLNALTGNGVFVITVNEYLSLRDKEEMGKIHEFLGLSVGYISRSMGPAQKREAYECDITYGTNSEFGFDYLRDNMAVNKSVLVQRKLNYAIIDEVDSILIDEARTPLIMSGDSYRPSQYYISVDKFVKSLNKEDYEKDNKTNSIHLTDSGMDKAERIFNLKNIADTSNTELLHHIRQSLQANYAMEKDQDYVVKDGEIVIVDKFTGRLMPGRTFGGGLHQAIEAKEEVEIRKETKTMAMITYQNFFRLFNKISGMTGTANTEKQEFRDIYGMDVVCIPTNNPVQRIDKTDLLYKTKQEKFKAIIKEVEKRHEKGQPILLGTIYIDESENLSKMLKEKNIPHNILNAKQDKSEAEVIELAGQRGAITIATNMAGRGTDIKLGEGVAELGGLYVIGTERHESRRIDNQLRGRSGRQGDPGESQFFISLEDSLLEKIDKDHIDKIKDMVEKLGLKEDEHIEDKLVSKAIEGVQVDIESMNYRTRKSTLEFDQILNKQRETIYKERNKILNGEDMSFFIKEIIKDIVYNVVDKYTDNSPYAEEWDLSSIQEYIDDTFAFRGAIDLKGLDKDKLENLDKQNLKDMILNKAYEIYSDNEMSQDEVQIRYMERLTLMKAIDEKWIDHLDLVEQLRQGTYFQHVGGNHAVRVFNQEAYEMFDNMLYNIKVITLKSLFTLMVVNEEAKQIRIKEEERKNKIGELEDKYKIDRKYLTKVPANVEAVKFNVDINATEKVKATLSLYYMDNGYEQKLEEFDKEIIVDGAFPVELKKEEYWELGWYQLKVLVGGIEATNMNFLVIEPKELDYEEMLINPDTVFFSNQKEEISFMLDIEDYESEYVTVYLVYNGDEDTTSSFNLKVRGGLAGVDLRKPKNGWKNGFYELVFYTEDRRNSLPFIMVDEFKEDEEEIKIKFNLENEENKEMNFVGQIVNVDERKIVANVPIKTNEDGLITLSLKNNTEIFKSGRYEFRLIEDTKVILLQYFLRV